MVIQNKYGFGPRLVLPIRWIPIKEESGAEKLKLGDLLSPGFRTVNARFCILIKRACRPVVPYIVGSSPPVPCQAASMCVPAAFQRRNPHSDLMLPEQPWGSWLRRRNPASSTLRRLGACSVLIARRNRASHRGYLMKSAVILGFADDDSQYVGSVRMSSRQGQTTRAERRSGGRAA